ncbi:MAG TPA: dipeptidase [Rikenellaceae bacterium]|nr:MAG: peptidase C69 [Bacteroidetes bacterium GWE2_40_15]HBZ26728.1 dipeptidase [Rikenellaceae bacterium]
MKKILTTILTAVIILATPSRGDSCTNVLVTKGASKDGSVMVTYSADSHQLYGELYFKKGESFAPGTMLKIYEWDTGKYLGEIPQIPKTYTTVGNMNEHQLIIGETTYGGLDQLVDTTGIMDYGSLIYIALQRAKTAREAIKVMTDLVKDYGYYSSGESFSIADKDEVWILELIGKGTKMVNGKNINKGAVWVAMRIPDGYISAHANQARITTFPKNDPENCIYSPDVIAFARENGLYKGSDKDFSFSDTYAPLSFGGMRGCEARVWAAFNILGGGFIGDKPYTDYLDYAMGHNAKNRMPLYIKPKEKISVKMLADVMRDHYEGTELDMTKDIGAGGHALPYRWRPMSFSVDGEKYTNERAIATQQTGFWFLGQARGWLPDEVGGILWFGVDDAATSALTPIYSSSVRVPECFRVGNGNMTTYSPTSAFWIFNRVTNFAYLRYDLIAPEVKKAVDKHEINALEIVPAIDAAALAIHKESPEKAREFLTDFSVNTAQQLFNNWVELDRYLLVKFIDGNVKKENSPGCFMDNGSGKGIPASPSQPGYSERWKRAVKEDAGARLKVK